MKTLWISLKMLLLMTLLTGILYPFAITAFSKLVFPNQSMGSLIKINGKIVGSKLIGQKFDSIAYFWPRPSAVDYNPLPSGASNYGPTSAKLQKQILKQHKDFIDKNELKENVYVPSEMLMASASGLDPHISPEAAYLQVNRVAKARNFNQNQRRQMVDIIGNLIEKPQFDLFGQSRVNILLLNLEINSIR
jgi:K+-transporting ATPase, C subunit